MDLDTAQTLVTGALAIVGGAAVIAAITPTTKDDAALAALRKILDVVAFNIAHAKNQKKDV